MSATAFSNFAGGRSDANRAKIYYCAALTAPSTMTGHIQTGDILVSINDVSLISDSTQSESKESSEAFFDIITDAIKNAGSPRTVRLLRPSRAKAVHSSPPPSVFEIHLSASEASFLFDRSFTTHIPKFTVGKVAFGKSFESAGGSLFDVVFPTQTSLGIRIFPYKLIDSHSASANHQIHRAVNLEAEYIDSEEEYDEEIIDDSSSVSSTAMKLFEEETRSTTDKPSSESNVMANITDFLSRLETERSNSNSPNRPHHAPQHNSEGHRRWSVDCGASSQRGTKTNARPTGESTNILRDDDIVTDNGMMSVGAHVSLLETVADDYIPVSSSVNRSGHIAENFFQEAAREELAARKGRISKFAVGDMVAIFESSGRKQTPPRSSSLAARGSPVKKTKAVAGLDDFNAGTPKAVKSSRRSLPSRMTPSKSMARVPSYLSPSTPSPTRRGRSPPRGYNIDDSAIHGAASAAETAHQELKRVAKENENLRAKMGFMQCSVSIEKQLLQYELKGAKARLLLAEKELEESTIEHKMNAISMQDDLDQSIKDIVSVMLQEKDDMAHKLHLARQDMTDMEVRYNDKIEAITEENENIKSELDGRKEDCVMLTADILNLQAERDCMKSSSVMTDFRTKNTNKTQSKELTRLRDVEKNTKSQMFEFIRDYDRTISTSASPEEVVSEFLNGRGIAINQNRRKHFAALKADNVRLYDGIDTMQELLEVETALQVARVELYTKSLVNKPVEKKLTSSPIKNKIKVLIYSESPAKTMRIPSNSSRARSEGTPSISPRKSNTNIDANVLNAPDAILSNRGLRSKDKRREKGSRKTLSSKIVRKVSSDELNNCKENQNSSESEGPGSVSNHSNVQKNEFEKENTHVKSTENKVCENNSEFASNPMKSFNSPTMPLKKSLSTSPSFIIITPRKKTPTTSPTSLLNSGSGAKVFPGLETSGSKIGGTFLGAKRPDMTQSPMVAISDEFLHTYPSVE